MAETESASDVQTEPMQEEAPAQIEAQSEPTTEQTEAKTPVGVPQKSPKTPRYRRTKQYHLYTPEQKATIAKFAAEHGNTRAANRFTKELGIIVPESTIRTFKKAYYAKLSEGNQPDDITEIPLRRRGRPRKGDEEKDVSSPGIPKSTRIKVKAKNEVMQVAGTPGFLDVSGDISLSNISNLIAPADGSVKGLVLLVGSSDGNLEAKEFADVAVVKAFPDNPDTSHISDDICSQIVALVIGPQIQVNLAFLSRCPKLKAVVQFGMGTDNVELEYAGRLGIIVCNVPDYGIEEVADTALAHILTLFRQTLSFHMNVVNGTEYRTYKDIMNDAKCRRIRGKTLGLVGLGKTGFAVAQRARAFGFNVAFYDPFIGTGWDKAFGGLERCKSLTDLVMKSDCVSLHCMLSEESRHIVNESLLRVFKRGAYLINVSRGALVDEVALARALKEGWIAGAALDVHEEEPFSFSRSPLKDAPNLICTPHISWYSKEGFAELRASSIRLVRQVLTASDADGIQNCVNKQHLDCDACSSRWNTIVD